MTDSIIVERLIARDNEVTRWFFYDSCRPLFLSIIKRVFDYPVSYDEIVNDIYQHLMEDDARRLRQFDFRSSIHLWIKTVSMRYLVAKKDRIIDDRSQEPLSQVGETDAVEPLRNGDARMDMDYYLSELGRHNPRYEHVVRRIMLEDAEYEAVAREMGVKVSNLYNIKKRAQDELTAIVLNAKPR